MTKPRALVLLVLFAIGTAGPVAQSRPAASPKPAASSKPAPAADALTSPWSAETWSGLKFRSIGPAVTSGRIADVAVDPTRPSRWYVASASGGVWKTENAGTSWTPIFDDQGSYSIGCVTLDPRNPFTVWVGTGENNNQRALGYGDGVYKSLDGGKSWARAGLDRSEHISRIIVHPKDSDTVFVAATGPVWSAGGDRGVYKTTDGGKTWTAVLAISEHTGVADLVMDPRDPDVLIAAAHQRRRHVWTYISGGPESAIYKTSDGGKTWRKITSGLPGGDIGRIGLAISPVNPDFVYAIVEAAGDTGGFFRSTDRGETWEKRSGYSSSGNYYSEIYADPKDVDRVYSMDTYLQVTDDGGRTWGNLGEQWKHVDNHSIWIDPRDTDHYVVGSDGGLYESFDRAATWNFKANLPVVQFYRISVDDASPVYRVAGGTQDNTTINGPSRTLTEHGASNLDWITTWGGDGFHTLAEPGNPDIVYSALQHGVLSRYDRKSGEAIFIQPQEGRGDPGLRWNWDSPLLISPHLKTRLYFAANRLFRSDDRGNSWTPVSPDLTRQIDRDTLKVMGKVWGPDAVAKSSSTSFYGNIVSLDESPKSEGLLYAGTDDGLVQVSEDGGGTWRKESMFPGVPDLTYVSDLVASQHDASVVYAAFNNHKMGDFKPYLLRSADRGRTWASIASNLPGRGSVWTLAEDPADPRLLFVGTEFGLFFTRDGGGSWVQLKGGIPTIAVRDIKIQAREHDLVVGTFGRGIFILDDYTPLRVAKPADLDQPFVSFPVKPVQGYIPSVPYGMRGKGFYGESFYLAPNPPYGAVFTYYLKDGLSTLKAQRQRAERDAAAKGATAAYPTRDQFVAEAREEAPAVIATVKDADGHVVRHLAAPSSAGFHRIAWDLRFPPSTPTSLQPEPTDDPFYESPVGPMVVPGRYTVSFSTRVNGVVTPVGTPQAFDVTAMSRSSLPEGDRAETAAFNQKAARLQRAVMGAIAAASEAQKRIDHIKKALDNAPAADPALATDVRAIERRLKDLQVALSGDGVMARRNFPTPAALADRVSAIVSAQFVTTLPVTGNSRQSYEIAAADFTGVLEQLRQLVETDLRRVEQGMESGGAPWTPGRVPVWKK
jgi:photosystem II stability/assembly factor-like uncharacterized protein